MKPKAVAERLGLALADFEQLRSELEARNFPTPDATTGCYCIEAVDRWRLLRHKNLFPELPIYAVMGGLHLGGVMERIIPDTVEGLRRFNISHIIAGHCTGWRALHALANAFGEGVSQSAVGTTYTFAADASR